MKPTLFITFFAFCTTLAFGEKLTASKFDFNGNGKIDPGHEAETLLKHVNSELYKEADADLDGQVSADELKSYKDNLDKNLSQKLSVAVNEFGTVAKSTNEVNKLYLGKNTPLFQPFGLMLRREAEDFTILSQPEEFSKSKGAHFGFTRDILNDNDVWQAQGALIRPFVFEDTSLPSFLSGIVSAMTLAPAIVFDRSTTQNNSAQDVNLLQFKLVSETELENLPLLDFLYFRAIPFYATDFDFRSSQLGGQVQLEPLQLDWGIGVSKKVPGLPVEFRLRPILNAEFGSVLDAGAKANLQDDERFFRVGPFLDLEIWPTAKYLDRVSFNVSWKYLEGFSGSPGASHLFETTASIRLDELGYAQFEISYAKGDVPLTDEKKDIFSIGLGLKF
jgi:hypothetical protein